MTMLVDVGHVPAVDCGCALEDMAKAIALHGTNQQEAMFRPLENRWARYLCEQVTARLQAILAKMEAALARFLGGHPEELRKADVPWLRWDEARFEQVRNYLESRDPALMSIDDYALLVDYLIQRYLPDGVIEDEADFLAVRATLLGKIQTNLSTDNRVTDPMIESMAALLPTEFAAIPPRVLTSTEINILTYGRAHAGENIRHVTESARHRMATICLEHAQGAILGQREGGWAYAKTRLFDEFGVLNRDFRRIAVTESGEMVNQGYVSAITPGQYVRRQEAYRGACDFCKSISGKIYQVVAPDASNKDGDTQVWPGKTNIGRSASAFKRVGDLLIRREPDEMWWAASGVQHPHCRGSWSPVTSKTPAVSQEFFDFLQNTLAAARS
jgi:hypothetical protein